MDSIVAENMDLAFDEITIESTSKYIGRSICDTDLRGDLSIGATSILEGDLLIIVGRADAGKLIAESVQY